MLRQVGKRVRHELVFGEKQGPALRYTEHRSDNPHIYLVRKMRPGKGCHRQHVVQEFCKLINIGANAFNFVRLLNRCEICAHLMRAASRRANDVVVGRKGLHE